MTGIVADTGATGNAAGTLTVRIDFHGPFRVGTGRPRPGRDNTVDSDDLLPASSLKGLMRASAKALLPHGKGAGELLDEVFGSERVRSPWHWSGAFFGEEEPLVTPRSRIEIDPGTGAARKAHLMTAEEVWARHATFTVTRTGPAPGAGVERDQLTLLACAAAGVHLVGAERRRGLGWVTFSPLGPVVDDELLARFEDLRSRHA